MCSNTWLSLAPSAQSPLHPCVCVLTCVPLSGSDSSFCFQKAAASTKCSGMMLAPKERCVSSRRKMPEKEAYRGLEGLLRWAPVSPLCFLANAKLMRSTLQSPWLFCSCSFDLLFFSIINISS